MAGPSDTDLSGSFQSPIGSLELNTLVAGIGAVIWIHLFLAAAFGYVIVPTPPNEWVWWYLPGSLLALVVLYLLGIADEGLADLAERAVTRKDGKLRHWYQKAALVPESGWKDAQRWMWTSPQASSEFARRRLRMLSGRNTAFNAIPITIALATLIVCRRPPLWGLRLAFVVGLGSLVCAVFGYVWVAAHRGWNQAVAAAGQLPEGRRIS